MRKVKFFVVLLALVHTLPVWADRGDQYVLPKVGIMTIDKYDADVLFSIGVLYGYGITPEITVEGELNLGLFGGAFQRRNSGVEIDSGDFRVGTLAGYGAYRFPINKTTYLKGKVGLLYENVKRISDTLRDDTAIGFGLTAGAGIGGHITDQLTLEGEITGLDKDVIFYSLGVHFAF